MALFRSIGTRHRAVAGAILVTLLGTYATSPLFGQGFSRLDLREEDDYVSWAVAFSPDGKTVASGGRNGDAIRLRDTQTGNLIRTLKGHSNDVYTIAFSPDGKTLASGGFDETIKLWDTQTGALLGTLKEQSQVYSVAFSPDGRLLVSGNSGGMINFWDPQTGILKRTIQRRKSKRSPGNGHSSTVCSISFAPDGKILASGSGDNSIKLWDVRTGNLIKTIIGTQKSPSGRRLDEIRIKCIAFSPDGKTLASGGWDRTNALWDVQTGQLKAVFEEHTGDVNSVAFSPDGKTLATGSNDDSFKLWDLRTRKVKWSLKHKGGDVHAVAFSPDSKILAVTTRLGTTSLIRIESVGPPPPAVVGKWDISTGPLTLSVQGDKVTGSYPFFNGQVQGELSNDGKSIAGTWKQSNGHSGGFVLTVSPDGKQISGRRWTGKKPVDGAGEVWSGKRFDEP